MPNSDTGYDLYAPPELPDITLFPDDSASQQLPPFPEPEVDVLVKEAN
jgi:hypothetical protein